MLSLLDVVLIFHAQTLYLVDLFPKSGRFWHISRPAWGIARKRLSFGGKGPRVQVAGHDHGPRAVVAAAQRQHTDHGTSEARGERRAAPAEAGRAHRIRRLPGQRGPLAAVPARGPARPPAPAAAARGRADVGPHPGTASGAESDKPASSIRPHRLGRRHIRWRIRRLLRARGLERILPRQSARITLVNDVNFLLYTPFLPEAAAGMLEPRHVVTPLRDVLEHTRLRIGVVIGARPGAADGHDARPGGPGARAALRPPGGRARLRFAGAADPRARRARDRVQVARRRDLAAQPRDPVPRDGRRRRRPGDAARSC